MPDVAPAIDVNRLHGVTRKTNSEVERDYQRYRRVTHDDGVQPVDIPADVTDDLDDTFAQKALWEGDGGSSFAADDLSVNTIAFPRRLEAVSISWSELATIIIRLVDEVEASEASTAKAKKNVERQMGLNYVAEKWQNNALNDVASWRGRVMVSSTCDAVILFSTSGVLSQIARAIAELRQTCNTISTQAKQFAKIAQLKMSTKGLEDKLVSYEASEDSLKLELAAETTKSNWIGQLLYGVRAEVADLQKRLSAKNAAIRSIVKD